jgi:hypothetical protein
LAVLSAVGAVSIYGSAQAVPTWFTAVDTNADAAYASLTPDDGGVTRNGVSDNGDIAIRGLDLGGGGFEIPGFYQRSSNSVILMNSETNTGTFVPSRSMSPNGRFNVGRVNVNGVNQAYVNNTGAVVGDGGLLTGYATGYNNMTAKGVATTNALGVNNLGYFIDGGSIYLPVADATTFASGAKLAGTLVPAPANEINDRVETSSNTSGTPHPVTGQIPIHTVWVPKANASRWNYQALDAAGLPTALAAETANEIYAPVGATLAPGQGRVINDNGDVGGWLVDTNDGITKPYVWIRDKNQFYVGTALGGVGANIQGMGDGGIGVGVYDNTGLFSGDASNGGLIFHPTFDASVDISTVTTGIPAGYTIFNAVGVGTYNTTTNTFYVGALATNGATTKLLLLTSSMGQFDANPGTTQSDLDVLSANLGGNPDTYDLTGDGVVDNSDRLMLIEGIRATRPGDANFNRVVDTVDFNVLAASFGQNGLGYASGNFDNVGPVDTVDFNLLAANFGFDNAETVAGAAAGSAVPEPASLGLLALGGLLAMRRSRRA